MYRCALILASSILVAITTGAVPAYASLVWTWNYSAPGISAGGTFNTVDTPDPQGGYLITAITGSRNGQAIIGLQAAGTPIPGNEPFAVDNLVFQASGQQLTKNGVGFALADGTYSNPFFADFLPTPGYLEFHSMPASGTSTEVPVAFSAHLASVPEPRMLTLMVVITVLGCLFWLRRRAANGKHSASSGAV